MTKRFNLMTAGAALALMAADTGTGTGGGAGENAPAPTDPNPDVTATTPALTPAEQKAADKAQAKADAKAAAAEAAEKDRYRILHDFHDTTTGRLRKAGKTLLATEARAAALVAAGVIDPDAVDDDDDDDSDAEQEREAAEAAARAAANVAPVGVDGPVDEAVARTIADGDQTGVTTGGKALSTKRVPGVITGGKP